MIQDFKKITKEVARLILSNPKARERKFKNRAIASLIIKKYNLPISIDIMADIVKDCENGSRAWRAFLRDHPAYRGSDYSDKKKLEQEHKLELGYVPGLAEQQKILKRL